MFLQILILILAIPTGLLVSRMAREELLQGRKWFLALTFVSMILAVGFFIYEMRSWALTGFFVATFSAVSYWKSFDKRWTKNL